MRRREGANVRVCESEIEGGWLMARRRSLYYMGRRSSGEFWDFDNAPKKLSVTRVLSHKGESSRANGGRGLVGVTRNTQDCARTYWCLAYK